MCVCVPQAILSTIVLVNLKGMFKQLMDVPMLWKTNRVDLVWLNPLSESFCSTEYRVNLVTPADSVCFCCCLAGVAGDIHLHPPAQPRHGSGCLHWFCHAHCHLQNTTVTTHQSLSIIDVYNYVNYVNERFWLDVGKSCCTNDIFTHFRPSYSILGQVPGTDLYLDTDNYTRVRY